MLTKLLYKILGQTLFYVNYGKIYLDVTQTPIAHYSRITSSKRIPPEYHKGRREPKRRALEKSEFLSYLKSTGHSKAAILRALGAPKSFINWLKVTHLDGVPTTPQEAEGTVSAERDLER